MAAGGGSGRFAEAAAHHGRPCAGLSVRRPQLPPVRSAGGHRLRRGPPVRGLHEGQKRQEIPPRSGIWCGSLGQRPRHCPLCRTKVRGQHHPHPDGEPDHEQPPKGPKNSSEQKRADYRRLRQR